MAVDCERSGEPCLSGVPPAGSKPPGGQALAAATRRCTKLWEGKMASVAPSGHSPRRTPSALSRSWATRDEVQAPIVWERRSPVGTRPPAVGMISRVDTRRSVRADPWLELLAEGRRGVALRSCEAQHAAASWSSCLASPHADTGGRRRTREPEGQRLWFVFTLHAPAVSGAGCVSWTHRMCAPAPHLPQPTCWPACVRPQSTHDEVAMWKSAVKVCAQSREAMVS